LTALRIYILLILTMNKNFLINLISSAIVDPKRRYITILLAVIYVISPFDIIPEFLPFVGLIDDGILIGLILNGFRVLSKLKQQQPKPKPNQKHSQKQPQKEEDVIDV
jgi:uncharacterized membrane protein YkvA (DUF1232 family)